MSKPMRRIGKILGYGLFGLVVGILSARAAFPYERLREYLEDALSQDGRYQVSVGEVSGAFPLGVEIRDLVLVEPPERPKGKPSKLQVDRAVIRLGLLSLLTGSREVSFDVEALGGRLEGQLKASEEEKRIAFSFRHIGFGKIPGISKAIDLPMAGHVSGKVSLKLPKEGLRRASGSLEIRCTDCSIGDGKTKVRPKFMRRPGRYDPVAEKGITLPRIRLGKFGGRVVIEKGRAEFEEFEALSPDGEAELLGWVNLRDPISFSTVQALFKFRFSEELKKRKPKIVGIEASMARGRRKDGLYGMCISGRIKRLRFRPCQSSPVERTRGRRGRSRRPPLRHRRPGRRPPVGRGKGS